MKKLLTSFLAMTALLLSTSARADESTGWFDDESFMYNQAAHRSVLPEPPLREQYERNIAEFAAATRPHFELVDAAVAAVKLAGAKPKLIEGEETNYLVSVDTTSQKGVNVYTLTYKNPSLSDREVKEKVWEDIQRVVPTTQAVVFENYARFAD